MANVLSIYSGAGEVSIYDSVRGFYYFGYNKEIEVTGEPQSHETMDGNILQYTTLYKMNVNLLQSNSDIISEIKNNRRSNKQTVFVVGMESLLKIENVFLAMNVKRPFKPGEPHSISLMAQTMIENDITFYENLLQDDGDFETDTNGDGLADGWTDYNLTSKSLVSSFLGSGNAQRIGTGGGSGEGYIYHDVCVPFEQPKTFTFSAYLKSADGSAHQCYLDIIPLDDGHGDLATYTKTIQVYSQVKQYFEETIDIEDSVAYVRTRIRIPVEAVIDIDHAQLELGHLSDYKNV